PLSPLRHRARRDLRRHGSAGGTARVRCGRGEERRTSGAAGGPRRDGVDAAQRRRAAPGIRVVALARVQRRAAHRRWHAPGTDGLATAFSLASRTPVSQKEGPMIDKVLTSIFGSKHERDVKRMWPIVNQISALEPEISTLSDDGLRAKTKEFRERRRPVVEALDNAKKEVPRDENLIKAAQADLQAALDDLLPEAFAVAREGGKRILNMRHFDVQLMGGIVLHHGKIAEMKTGEGKTLVATLPVYLNALTGRGVHLVTVNDYLARRDSEWMGRIYRFLGLSVGVIQNHH